MQDKKLKKIKRKFNKILNVENNKKLKQISLAALPIVELKRNDRRKSISICRYCYFIFIVILCCTSAHVLCLEGRREHTLAASPLSFPTPTNNVVLLSFSDWIFILMFNFVHDTRKKYIFLWF